jgi:hypothetical protein
MRGYRSIVSGLLMAAVLGGCARQSLPDLQPGGGDGGAVRDGKADAPVAGAVVPIDGAGLLERACTQCHPLRGLSAYQDYWGAREWRSMIQTMVGYGARLSPEEADALARWLGRNYGNDRE